MRRPGQKPSILISNHPKYDAALEKAFDLLQHDPNSGSNHPNGLIMGTCKDEVEKLKSLAKIIQEKGEKAGKKQLAENIWIPGPPGMPEKGFWAPRGSKIAKEFVKKAEEAAKKAEEAAKKAEEAAIKKAQEAAKKVWEGIQRILGKPPRSKKGNSSACN